MHPAVSHTVLSNPPLLWVGSAFSDANSTTYDFGNFVARDVGRLIIHFHARGNNADTVSSITVNGTAATIHDSTAANNQKWAIASLLLPGAGAYDVQVTLSATNGANPAAAVGVWLLTRNLDASPISASGQKPANGTSDTLSFNIKARSVSTFGHHHIVAGETMSWSQAIKRVDIVGAANASFGFADSDNAVGTPFSETVSWTTSSSTASTWSSWQV